MYVQSATGQNHNTRVDHIDQMLIKLKFNGSVLVARRGEIIYEKQLGAANMEFDVPISRDTKFEIASLTKPFTAILTLQLAQAGKLNLEDRLTKYFPEVRRSDAETITIRHMLSHTSGIQDYVGISPEFGSWSDKKVVEELEKATISFIPGTKFQYSSSTYILLRILLERATGKSYEQLLEEQILVLAGMTQTGVIHNQEVIQGKASGYIRTNDGIKNAYPILNPELFVGAASVYTTANDLLKFDRALYSGTLLSNEFQKLMYTPVQKPYSYGWFIKQTDGRSKVVSHGGDTFGYTSLLQRVLDSETLIVVLSNMQSVDRDAIVKILDGLL